IMPEMDGQECFRTLRQLNPNVKAILSTGWGSDGSVQGVLDEGMIDFVQKPYQMEQLAAAVDRALRE
ncbi:MAG: response regulator, partial [Chloroflexi bacterium]|nr:response regulator [Chloroflexota bacterium]